MKTYKQPEAFTKGQKVSVDWHDPHGDGSFSGHGEFIRHLVEGDVGDELLKDGPHVVVKCTPDDSGSIFPLSAVKVIQQAAPQTDTPETNAYYEHRISGYHHGFESYQIILDYEHSQGLERRAIAAEARVDELESALRLRPIAEAGPVPDGAVRVYAMCYDGEWFFSYIKSKATTHFIDIYPPALAEEGQARP